MDPGASTGWAVFDGPTLVDCGACPYDRPPTWTHIEHVVAEIPQAYPDLRVDPNDLITLAYRLGVVVGPLAVAGIPVVTVLPRVWKGGNIGKAQHHPRIVAKLSGPPRELYERVLGTLGAKARTDMTDAVGIGQWALRTGLWT